MKFPLHLAALVVLIGSCPIAVRAADGGLAKVTAVQNTVESKAAAAAGWSPSTVGESLGANARIRTGAGSRAAIVYSDQTLQRLNEKSEIEILPPSGGGTGILKVLSGQTYFTTRTPKDFGRVETRTVTAAIKGTEFAVSVAEDGTTVITMIEGVVEASNEFGQVTITRGEEAVTQPGKAPQRRIAVRPKDAVAWSLYYPEVLGGSDAARLKEGGAGGQRLAQAAQDLSNGQVDAARSAVDEARAADPKNPIALALASVILLTTDRRDEARAAADSAMAADASSPAALLARSFVAQADFDLERARDLAEKAAELDPESSEALARAAELRLALGDHGGAKRAAEAAVSRQPQNARALTVLGFVNLADYRTKDAAAAFDRAVQADSGFPLAHAGRGIAQIRLGHVVEGREELQTAATLDPAESLYRSYLGKAYYEEKRAKEAGKELAAAKSLDPMDPTPWLYSAILLQNENRPIEALEDLNGAIDRNDNRAVYRSRMLLDQDGAVRSADLARIYGDLGFETLGLVSARQSADRDQANFSSHLFLAENYRTLPNYASSFLSETLQARVYQPVGVNAVRPDAPGGTVGFNEYTALFDRPRARGFVSGSYGYTDTNLEEYFPGCGAPCQNAFGINDSRNWSGDGTATYNTDRFAGQVRIQKVSDDGFRINNDQDNMVYSAFVEGAASSRDTIQFNAIVANRTTGDLPVRQIPLLIAPERFDTDERNFGLAWHRRISPAADLAVSAIWNNTDQKATGLLTPVTAEVKLSGPQLEAQYVLRTGRVSWITGAGAFDGTFDTGAMKADELFGNVYAYAKLSPLGPLEIVGGVSVESSRTPVGLLAPRDSYILASDVTYDKTQPSPKVGATLTFKSGTTLRAAVFSRLASGIGRLQTLEPTQVSGFNQFYEDVGGTRSWNYGLGFDQQIVSKLFFGASWLRRNLQVPEADCPVPDRFSGCAFQVGSVLMQRHSYDDLGGAYVNALIGKRVAVSANYDRDERRFDTTRISPLGFFQDDVKTERYRSQARVFLPCGFFASAAANYYHQRVDQFDDLISSVRRVERPRFWTLDAAIGYRLPKRLGSISLEGTNLSDREFDFYDQALQENVLPARRVVLRADFAF
jgi:predicted Zn-dependent protease